MPILVYQVSLNDSIKYIGITSKSFRESARLKRKLRNGKYFNYLQELK